MEAMLDGVEYRLQTDEGISDPVLLTFATGPSCSGIGTQ